MLEQFGRFRLIKRIAVGGMGEVFLAHYLTAAGIERQTVVKRILPRLSKNPKFVSYFLNEGRIASLLCHPNVVQTIELGRTADQYYIAMEFIPGETLVHILANAMATRQRMSISLFHYLVSQIAAALAYTHNLTNLEGDALNIIHMDLAPHNILVTPDLQVKLLDFGISRATGLDDPPVRREFRGRTAYLAPEQLDGLPLDRRVDLFAMGIIMHEMLLTRPLFRASSDQQTSTRILYHPIPRPSAHRPDCPGLLEEIVLKALERERQFRYGDAVEIVEDLDNISQMCSSAQSKAQLVEELAQLTHGKKQDSVKSESRVATFAASSTTATQT